MAGPPPSPLLAYVMVMDAPLWHPFACSAYMKVTFPTKTWEQLVSVSACTMLQYTLLPGPALLLCVTPLERIYSSHARFIHSDDNFRLKHYKCFMQKCLFV